MSFTILKFNFGELYAKLPPDLQEILYSENTSLEMDRLANKYKLEDLEGRLSEMTGLVLLGVLHPKDFINDIADKLGVDRDTAKKIANDVNQEIFQKVRLSLRKLHHITDQDIVAPAAPPPAPKVAENVAKIIIREDTSALKVEEKKIILPPPPPPIAPILKMPLPTPKAVGATLPPPVLRVSPPKVAPKIEIRPLEIRPIKGFEPLKPRPPQSPLPTPKGDGTSTPKAVGAAPVTTRDRGLEVMPASPEELKKIPAPPAGLPFLKTDSYREKI